MPTIPSSRLAPIVGFSWTKGLYLFWAGDFNAVGPDRIEAGEPPTVEIVGEASVSGITLTLPNGAQIALSEGGSASAAADFFEESEGFVGVPPSAIGPGNIDGQGQWTENVHGKFDYFTKFEKWEEGSKTIIDEDGNFVVHGGRGSCGTSTVGALNLTKLISETNAGSTDPIEQFLFTMSVSCETNTQLATGSGGSFHLSVWNVVLDEARGFMVMNENFGDVQDSFDPEPETPSASFEITARWSVPDKLLTRQ
jgi:hypothetical protein